MWKQFSLDLVDLSMHLHCKVLQREFAFVCNYDLLVFDPIYCSLEIYIESLKASMILLVTSTCEDIAVTTLFLV